MKRILIAATALTLAAGSAFAATSTVQAPTASMPEGTSVTALNGNYGTVPEPQGMYSMTGHVANWGSPGWGDFEGSVGSDGGGN